MVIIVFDFRYNQPMENITFVQQICVLILPLLFAITLHEVAHGWVARLYGDNTAEQYGRLTLNPIRHIDPLGTVLVPALMLLSGFLSGGGAGFIFGWAKPVPVDWSKLRNPKRDMAIVAVAGPAANLLMAVFWALVVKMGIILKSPFASEAMIYMGGIGIGINLVFMLLNLLPVPPLDGGRIVTSLLPGRLAWSFSRLEPYGLFIMLALVVSGLLGPLLSYPMPALQRFVQSIAGL